MTETELQQAVIECARLFGWRVAHFRPAMTRHGWRTPVQADGKGFPDLCMARDGVIAFAEIKSDKGKLAPEQEAWRDEIEGESQQGPEFYVWRPRDWLSGQIEVALR